MIVEFLGSADVDGVGRWGEGGDAATAFVKGEWSLLKYGACGVACAE